MPFEHNSKEMKMRGTKGVINFKNEEKKNICAQPTMCCHLLWSSFLSKGNLTKLKKIEFAWCFQKKSYLVSKLKLESTVKSRTVECFV